VIKVLNITGWGRSGSTIIASLLGQIDGFVSVGELRQIWDRGLLRNMACACSRSFRDCPVWSRVASGYIERSQSEIRGIMSQREGFDTLHCAWQAIRRDSSMDERLLEYSHHLVEILRNLQTTTGCRVVVDSSKRPQHGYVLGLNPDVDLHILHLVRDPRGVAHSWKRKRVYSEDGGQPQYMKQFSASVSSMHWVARNALAEYLWRGDAKRGRYLLLRYEDFTREPREVIQRIRDFMGEDGPLDFFLDDETVEMKPTHEISGNPSRFNTGRVEIRADARWREEMEWKDRATAATVALPLLFRYGYGPSACGRSLRPHGYRRAGWAP